MFEVNINGRKQRYRSKPTMNVDTTGSSGDVSIPKPLTYDYMPEGYPSKSVETVTLMEEQEVTFADVGKGVYGATAPVKIDVLDGQTYTVVWDGVEYSCVGHVTRGGSYIGNPAAYGLEATGEPFVYANASQPTWVSYDTATSHTISVTTQGTVYKTIDKKFLPEAGKFVVYEITETWDDDGNSIYSCELPFNDAYAMEEQKLLKSIKYSRTNPSVVRKGLSTQLGKNIALKFEIYGPNSDMTVTVRETLFIWLSDGLHKATRKTS